MAALCLMPALCDAPARAGTAYVDGISDQDLPAWDGGFAESYFGRLFSAVWVSSGHISLARYVAQWDVMSEAGGRADPQGDYREKLEAWLGDVATLGLVPDVSLTSYDGVYPRTVAQYQTALGLLLDRATAMGHPVHYVEAWNEPNDQGAEPAVKAAQLTNSADALCARRYACTVVAGNLQDSPDVATYERRYERALDFTPAIWGVHPYYSVERESQAPLDDLIENLPHGGAGARIWFTEIAARECTDHGGRLVDNGENGQAKRSRWLVDTLMRDRAPEHAFYFSFLPGERRQPSCAKDREDDALYEPSSDAGAPDTPRPAASYIWGARANALAAFCSEPLPFQRFANDRPVAIAWSSAGAAPGWSLPILTNGCTALAGNSTPTFIP